MESKTDGEQNQEAVHARDDDVHGVGTLFLAPRQRLTSMHREERRGQVAGPESHEQDSSDTQTPLSTSRLPDAKSERDQRPRATERSGTTKGLDGAPIADSSLTV